ncbi:hypothetical protein PATY110618_01390 [Paenibacillus typhae]
MVGDDNDLFTVKFKLGRKRLARAVKSRIIRVDSSRIVGKLISGCVVADGLGCSALLTIDAVRQLDSRCIVKEADTDISARCSAVCIINRSNINISVRRASGCLNRLNQLGSTGFNITVVAFTVAVLHFNNADDIRLFHIYSDGLGQLLNLCCAYARVVVLDIVGCNQQLVLIDCNR